MSSYPVPLNFLTPMIYELKNGEYERSLGSEPFWLPELGLGIGRNQGVLAGVQLEWLTWFNGDGHPYPLPEEAIDRERRKAERAQRRTKLAQQRADQEFLRAQREFLRAQREQQRAERLAAQLRALGIEPDE